MKCSKPRSAYRPLLEDLESRLQPGSMITGQGYGWSLLADQLSLLNPGSLSSQSVLVSSPESSRPNSSGQVVEKTGPSLHSVLTNLAAVRSTTLASNTPSTNAGPSASLTSDGLGQLSLASSAHAAPFIHVAAPASGTPQNPTPVNAGFLESPVGVAAPAQTIGNLAGTTGANTLTAPVGGQGGAAGNTQTVTPTALGAPETGNAGALIANGATLHTGPVGQLITTHVEMDGIHTMAAQPIWSNYIGRAGTQVLGMALSPVSGATQPVVVTGVTQNSNDPTENDLFVATYSTDGTSMTIATLGFGTGTNTSGRSVDVDANGNIYIAGRMDAGGQQTGLVISLTPGATAYTINWTETLSGNTTATVNGLRLDSTGTNLYVVGGADGNLFVGEFTDLNTSNPTIVYGSEFNLTATGNAVAPDSQGDADIAFSAVSGSNNFPAIGQVTPDGSNLPYVYYRSVGANAGMNGITVDAGDNIYATGAVGDTTSPFLQLLVAKFDVTLSAQYAWAYQVGNNGTRTADFVGYDIKVDNSGDAFMASGTNDGTGGNMSLFEVDPTGAVVVDYEGNAFGSNDDENRALALDTTNNVAYLGGFTNSPDFNFTSNSAQPNYGGDPYDGIVIQYQLS